MLEKSGRSAEPSFVCVCSSAVASRERGAAPSHLELSPDVAVFRMLNYTDHRWVFFFLTSLFVGSQLGCKILISPATRLSLRGWARGLKATLGLPGMACWILAVKYFKL